VPIGSEAFGLLKPCINKRKSPAPENPERGFAENNHGHIYGRTMYQRFFKLIA
jgi:hypothetical protein